MTTAHAPSTVPPGGDPSGRVRTDDPVLATERRILGAAAVDGRATVLDDPAAGSAAAGLPALPGFVESTFSPLAYEASRRCLSACPGDGARTAVVLASLMGDTTTADLASQRLIAGRVHNPLLFMQATANSVLGYLSREFEITGQQLSLSTLDDPLTESLAMADVFLDEPDVDRVLLVAVELAGNARVAAVHAELGGSAGRPIPPDTGDLAVAVLLARAGSAAAGDPGPTVAIRSVRPGVAGRATNAEHRGNLQSLLDLARTYHRLRRDGGSVVLVTDPPPGRTPAEFAVTATTTASLKDGTDAQ